MAVNRQLQNVRDGIYFAELEDTREWNRAKVRECVVSAVIMAQRFTVDDERVAEMLARWPAECTVRYEWFRSLALRPELQVNPLREPSINSLDNVYRVLARWLDLIDSNMDRTVLILNSCELSFDKIAKMFGENRQTISRRNTKCLELLVYKLNHIPDLKWPVGTKFNFGSLSAIPNNKR